MSAAASTHQATDPKVSAWVSANAGAGKTYLLTDRVTRLLLSGANPARILCLTYTKAAAAEMSSRLFARLGEWSLFSDDELKKHLNAIGAEERDAQSLRGARRLFAQALETPGGLKIQTIHSFCQHVLSRFPVEAGVPPRFSVLDERSAAELMAMARNAILERASAGDTNLARSVAVLATQAGDGRFAEILDLAIGQSGKLRRLIGSDEKRFFSHMRKCLDVAEGDDEAAVLTRFCAELGGDREECERFVNWLRAGSPNDRKTGESLAEFLRGGMKTAHFGRLRLLFFTKDNEPRRSIFTRACGASNAELAERFEQLRDRVAAAEERRRAAVTAALTEALITVALAVVQVYDRLKRERAALDYDDLTRATLALLEKSHAAEWVLYKLDGGLDHILVDEAQDTSPQQWQIVVKLAEEFFSGEGVRRSERPRTLFAVGDEKQSIYSFQGADPDEFGRHLKLFKSRIESAGLAFADLRPAISRRSARTVLEFVDEVFANDAARDGLSSLGGAIRHDPFRAEIGRVEIWPAVKAQKQPERDLWQPVDAPSPESASVKLATLIAERIQGWLKNGATLPGSREQIRPGDIMILVRRRNAFAEEMIRQLMERGVPVAGADRMVLMDQIAIADLVTLGRFVLLPEDDLNLASLLKSPLVGLTEDELFALAQPRQGGLWDELRARQDERREFARANAFLTELRAQADFLPPFEFYARALGKGLRKKLVARFGAEAADAIDEFLALALSHESAHPPSLESFLDWFERGASEVKRDMEQGLGSVRVMTVHGAKGLEANIVILPDTAQVPEHERRAGILYTEDSAFFGVPKALETEAVAKAKAASALREMREYRRLFYVALTRAREWLILTGYETQNGVRPQSWYPLILTAKTASWREESRYGETVYALGADFSSASPRSAESEATRASLPDFLSRAAPPEPAPRTLRPSEAAGADEPPLISPVEKGGARFKRGILIHTLLAQLPEIAPEARESTALAYLTRQGLKPEQAEALKNEAMAILRHPDFGALFGPGSRAEVPIVASLPELGNVRVSGQIDRLAVTEDSVLIADFKTNRPPPATPEETPALYRAQMALYRAALAKIYPGRRIACALVWTEQPRLMTLPAELLDAEIARIAARRIG